MLTMALSTLKLPSVSLLILPTRLRLCLRRYPDVRYTLLLLFSFKTMATSGELVITVSWFLRSAKHLASAREVVPLLMAMASPSLMYSEASLAMACFSIWCFSIFRSNSISWALRLLYTAPPLTRLMEDSFSSSNRSRRMVSMETWNTSASCSILENFTSDKYRTISPCLLFCMTHALPRFVFPQIPHLFHIISPKKGF